MTRCTALCQRIAVGYINALNGIRTLALESQEQCYCQCKHDCAANYGKNNYHVSPVGVAKAHLSQKTNLAIGSVAKYPLIPVICCSIPRIPNSLNPIVHTAGQQRSLDGR